jgi:hypothetical protein
VGLGGAGLGWTESGRNINELDCIELYRVVLSWIWIWIFA